MNDLIKESFKYISQLQNNEPKIGLILGSGLGSFADLLENKTVIETSSVPNFPHSTVEGHAGNLVFGFWNNASVLALQGRTHYYEGYDIEKITFVIRIMSALNIKILIITNAAGGVNSLFKPGDLMLITDHINMMFKNPLRGPLKYGPPRFPDMSSQFALEYYDNIEKIALRNRISLQKGVLYSSTGPTYETKSEVKMINKIGADAVSMSTVPEVLVANHANIKVLGISCITNMATGVGNTVLTHEEVTETAQFVSQKFKNLLGLVIDYIHKEIT